MGTWGVGVRLQVHAGWRAELVKSVIEASALSPRGWRKRRYEASRCQQVVAVLCAHRWVGIVCACVKVLMAEFNGMDI